MADTAKLARIADDAVDAIKATNKVVDSGKVSRSVSLPKSRDQLEHIFGNRKGHLTDYEISIVILNATECHTNSINICAESVSFKKISRLSKK